MWTLIDSLIILISLAVHAGLFFIAHQFRRKPFFQRIGEKVLIFKEKSLNRNLLLRFFKWNVDKGRGGLAAFIIGLLIFLKGMMMLLVGIVFGGIHLVPIQGALMSVLILAMQKKGMPVEGLKKTQNLQLASMLWLNAAGNLMGYHYWVNEQSLTAVIGEYYLALIFLILIGLVLSLVTATHEVKFFKKHRTFLS